MIFSLFFLPAVMYGNSDVKIKEDRIKELEEVRFKKEEEISRLRARIYNEAIAYQNYRDESYMYWKPSGDWDREASFDEFFLNFCRAFEEGEDTEILCEKASFVKVSFPNVHLITLSAALQFLFGERLIAQYKQLVQELVEINKELNKLK